MKENQTELLILGAGPGGYVAAIRAAQKGREVTIVDKGELGGTCLNVGCIPSKALIEAGHYAATPVRAAPAGIHFPEPEINFQQLQQWKSGIVQQLTGGVKGLLQAAGVTIVKGEAAFVDPNRVKVAGRGRKSHSLTVLWRPAPLLLKFRHFRLMNERSHRQRRLL